MTDNPWEDPGWLAYAQRCIDELGPKIDQSAVTIAMVPRGPADVKMATELGFMILMDKPIIAIVLPGARISSKLAKVADAIVEGDLDDPRFIERLKATIEQLTKKRSK